MWSSTSTLHSEGLRWPKAESALSGWGYAPSGSAALALRPLCLATERLWCDHVYPRWGEHTSSPGKHTGTTPVLGASASIMGSEFSVYLVPALRSALVLCCRASLRRTSYMVGTPPEGPPFPS